MAASEKTVGILGIGNLLLGDEGFGVHVIRYLEENYSFPEQVRLLDGGTAGIYMAPFLEEVDRLIVVDVVAADGAPGTIHVFNGDDLKGAGLQMRMSPHQLGLLEVLEISKLREQAPDEVGFIVVVPEKMDISMELSDTVRGKVIEVAEMIIATLEREGIYARNIAGAGPSQAAC
ncbi:MAG: HyaD/HybD family hydrogenase maturation endopeptidase [Pseudomonadota bacterium]